MNNKPLVQTLAAVAVALATLPANAYDYAGSTDGAPTYHRLEAGGSPPFALSPYATSVAYSSFSFSVDTSGSYEFISDALWDNYTFLYEGSFDAAAPQANVLNGNDDYDYVGRSGFSQGLVAGATYVLVTTGFTNFDAGAFSNSITGIGEVHAVPEPGTWALMTLGVIGLVAWRRRMDTRKA